LWFLGKTIPAVGRGTAYGVEKKWKKDPSAGGPKWGLRQGGRESLGGRSTGQTLLTKQNKNPEA